MPSNTPQISPVDQLAGHFKVINERLASLERASSSGSGGGGGIVVVEGTDPPPTLPPGSFFFDTDCEPPVIDFQAQIDAIEARLDALEANDAGAWTAYTPTTTNITLGTSALSGGYQMINASSMLVVIRIGSGTAVATAAGVVTFTLPAGWAVTTETMMPVWFIRTTDGGAATVNGNIITGYASAAGGTFTAGQRVDFTRLCAVIPVTPIP